MTPKPVFPVVKGEYLKKCWILETKLLQDATRKPQADYSMVLVSMTLRDPHPIFKVIVTFQIKYLKNGTG